MPERFFTAKRENVPPNTDSLSISDSLLLLNSISGLGPVTYRRLLDEFGEDPRLILQAGNRELRAVRGVGDKMIDSLTAQGHEAWLAKEKEKLEERQVSFLGTDSYPPHLNEIYDAPIGLYLAGRLPEGPYVCMQRSYFKKSHILKNPMY